MHKKGNLFSLIKSLSMAEKRFFKVYAASNKTDKNYLLLFDFIDKQERYDEPAIKAHFADRQFVKQLHVTKIYLSNLILKALRSFHAKPTKSVELKNLLLEVEILFRKGLFDQCHYTIEKAIAIAEQQDTIAALLSKITAIPQKYGLKYLSPVTVKLLLRTYNMELELYRDTGRYAQGVALAEKIKDFLETHHRFAPAEYQLSIYYQFAYLYFMQQDFRQALFWLNEIFRRNFGAVREDLQSYAQLLHLIIHFELGNTAVLKYAVDSCRRFLKKKRSLQSFERVLLRYFSRLSTTLPEKHRALLEKMQAELFAETAEKDKANVLDFLDFEAWLQRKLNE